MRTRLNVPLRVRVDEWAELLHKGRHRSMQRSEGPASYSGRPVAGSIPREVSWISDVVAASARSNHALNFDPTGEQCARTAPPENRHSRSASYIQCAVYVRVWVRTCTYSGSKRCAPVRRAKPKRLSSFHWQASVCWLYGKTSQVCACLGPINLTYYYKLRVFRCITDKFLGNVCRYQDISLFYRGPLSNLLAQHSAASLPLAVSGFYLVHTNTFVVNIYIWSQATLWAQ